MKEKYRMLGKGNSKKTRSKKQRIDKLIKSIDRREKRKSKVKISKDFMPIDLLNDPFTFCEKFFSKLKSVSEKFKLKIVMIRLLARIICRHKLLINNFFSYILSYINPSQKDLATIFASVIEATHDLVPPDDLNPILDKLFDNFITESIPPAQITIGLNAYREICERVPYIMTKAQMTVIENMRDFKNKSVAIAARAAINLCKEISPHLIGESLDS
jgi:protein SDA1